MFGTTRNQIQSNPSIPPTDRPTNQPINQSNAVLNPSAHAHARRVARLQRRPKPWVLDPNAAECTTNSNEPSLLNRAPDGHLGSADS